MPTAHAPNWTLATDLDGTLIPIAEHPDQIAALADIRRWQADGALELIFVTGRHLELVQDAIAKHQLPLPDWIIADVGTSLFRREIPPAESSDETSRFSRVEAYFAQLGGEAAANRLSQVRERIAQRDGVRLQEAEKQNDLKASFYIEAVRISAIASELRAEFQGQDGAWEVIDSVDPFTGRGLLDILPAGASKAFALQWWVDHQQRSIEHLVFAGDSGNDWAALIAGQKAILVGNADRELARRVYEHMQTHGSRQQLYLARQSATSGVVEGLHWFGFTPTASDHLASTPQPQASRSPAAAPPAPPARMPSESRLYGVTPVHQHMSFVQLWAPQQSQLAIQKLSTELLESEAAAPVAADFLATHANVSPSHEAAIFPLSRTEDGLHHGWVPLGPGDAYCLRLADGTLRPDPCSRYQPCGVHGPSLVVSGNFPWQDAEWQGLPKEALVFYELHVGAFSSPGDFAGVEARLDELVELGITAVELMPVAESPGRWNWGYDGTYLFAVEQQYGTPDDLRILVDACHRRGLAVILDVVYNHFGPEGNYLGELGPYFSSKHRTPWGETPAFDGRHAERVRQLMLDNVRYWITEFHLDGLRLDAVHFMFDASVPHIMQELKHEMRQLEQEVGRTLHLIAEANVFDPILLGKEQPELRGCDALWCDDLLHAAQLTVAPHESFAHREYRPGEDLLFALQHGYLYSGTEAGEYQRQSTHSVQKLEPADFTSLIVSVQNHDKVGNHPLGRRLHHVASLEAQLALAPLALLYPALPLIFMGEEYAADSPFRFFSDFQEERLRRAVDRGRRREYPHESWEGALTPSDPEAFLSSKLPPRPAERRRVFEWYQCLLAQRKAWLASGVLDARLLTVEATSDWSCFLLRYATHPGETAFVLTYFPPTEADEPHSLNLSGRFEWLLDSLAPHPGQRQSLPAGKLEFAGIPRAIVGSGELDWGG